jgi:hypothetical protein
MQSRFWGRKITIGDIEKLRTLRHLKMTIQKALTETENKKDAGLQDIILNRQRLKEVQKTLVKHEDYLISIELGGQ